MTILRHGLTAADREAMIAFRAKVAAHPVAITRASYDAMLEQMPSADSVSYTETSIAGVRGVWCAPATSSNKAAVLYLHGGVFVYGTAHAYRHFAGRIAARSGAPVFVADYRRAPEEPFPAALDDTVAAYRGLAARHDARNIAVVGDSAGGGLALSLLQSEPGARCGVLFSPWTDLALTGGSIEGKASEDAPLSRPARANTSVTTTAGTHVRPPSMVPHPERPAFRFMSAQRRCFSTTPCGWDRGRASRCTNGRACLMSSPAPSASSRRLVRPTTWSPRFCARNSRRERAWPDDIHRTP